MQLISDFEKDCQIFNTDCSVKVLNPKLTSNFEKILFFSIAIFIFAVLIAYFYNVWRKNRTKRQTEGNLISHASKKFTPTILAGSVEPRLMILRKLHVIG